MQGCLFTAGFSYSLGPPLSSLAEIEAYLALATMFEVEK